MNLLMFVTDPVYRDTGDTDNGSRREFRRGLTDYRSKRQIELITKQKKQPVVSLEIIDEGPPKQANKVDGKTKKTSTL